MSSVLRKLFPAAPEQISIEQAAELLRTSPAALAALESAYAGFEGTGIDPRSIFSGNSRSAAADTRDQIPGQGLQELVERIAQELLSLPAAPHQRPVLEAAPGTELVTAQQVEVYGKAAPQLTGTLTVSDIEPLGYRSLLQMWSKSQTEPDPRKRSWYTNHFRQGLDILDLDPVMHAMLGMNPNSASHWMPALQAAIETSDCGLLVPATKIATVPLPILQLTRLDFGMINPASKAVVDRWAQVAFELDPAKDYFIKTGTYSSKFDFRNAKVTDPNEVMEIGQYLLWIQHQASSMASPMTLPGPVIGASTTNEWVVREWIEDASGSPSIYHGMPLRTEFRVFIDADSDQVLAVAPYWDPETMKNRFENAEDSDRPDMLHDAVIFRAHEPVLMERFARFKDVVAGKVQQLLPHLELTGQWSLDIMLNDTDGEQLYAIDMALANESALSHYVPAGLLKDQPHSWIPELGTVLP